MPALRHDKTSRRVREGFALIALAAFACRSPEEHLRDADREAYELVARRRDELALGAGAFTIEPDPLSLRRRIESGETHFGEPVSLVRLLQIAAESSREFQSQKEGVYLAALDLTLERWELAFQEGGSLGAFMDRNSDEDARVGGDAAVGFTKLFGTGARLVGNLGLDIARSWVSSDGWDPTSTLSLSITQPLLAGFGERIVLEPLTQAERNLVYEVRVFERFRRTFAFDVASRAYRLLQLEDAVRNQEANFANLQALSERNAALAEAGRLSDIELGQARQNELRSRNSLLEARARLAGQRDDLALFVGLPVELEIAIDRAEIERLADERVREPLPAETDAVSVALAARLDHATVLDREDDAERKAIVAEDALRAGLELAADVQLSSKEGKPLTFNRQDTTWRVGLNYSFPWERLPQRNVWRETLIAREGARRDAEQSADEIRADLRADAREAQTSLAGYEIQLDAVRLAEARVESTRLNLEAGRADTRDVLESEESLLSARNAATAALVDYTLARMRYYLDMELLLVDESGIRLEDLARAAPALRPASWEEER